MEYISSKIAEFVFLLSQKAASFGENLRYSQINYWQAILDILVVALVFYLAFSLIRGTRAKNALYGLLILGAVLLVSKNLNLLALSWIIEKFFTILLIAIPIIFQNEIRLLLEKIGIKTSLGADKITTTELYINSIVEACQTLAKKEKGALIVIQHDISLKDYVDNGTKINGEVSKELLLSIFDGKGPLHDGAVILDKTRILAAGSTLPTSFEIADKSYGTRHKAACGVTEHTDASAIVVSEEKGTISFAKNGRLEKSISEHRLQQILRSLLVQKSKKQKSLKYIIEND